MSLWAQYIKERNGMETLEHEFGFMTYKIQGEECYIEDAFILPAHRQKNMGSLLLEEIEQKAREAGCKHLTSVIRPSEVFATGSMKAQLAVGFKIYMSTSDKIIMMKGL